MDIEKSVPEIRFKGFSGEWVEKELGFVSDIKTGPFGSTLHAEAYVSDGYPIITTEHFKSGELSNDKKGIPQVCDEDYLRLKAYLLRAGDIVFSRVGSVDINAHIKNKQEGWLFSGRVLRVRSKNSIDSEYLHHELSTSRVKKSVVSRAVGQTMPSINTEILKITPINFPIETKEQTQIGNYFQKLDNLINQHQQKHDKLSNIKKAMLEKMFPKEGETIPEIRFSGFGREWKKKQLREVGSFASGVGFSESEQSGTTGIPFFKVSDMSVEGNDYCMASANNYVNNEQILRLNYKPICESSIVFAKVGAAVFLERKRIAKNFLIDNNMMAFSPTEDIVFMKYWFDSINLSKYTQVGALPSFRASDLSVINIRVPSSEEQEKVGDYFKNLDALISQHQQQIIKLNNIKQACLSKMFV